MINNLVLESKVLTLPKHWSTSRVGRLWSLCWIRTFLLKLYNTWKKKKTNKNKNLVSCHHLTQMLHCFARKHAVVTWSRRQLNSSSLSILRFTCAAKSTITKLNVAKISQNVFSPMVTFYIRGLKLMLFSCCKFCCWWQNILFSIDRPENFLLLFLKTVYQYLFTFGSVFFLHKASQQNLYLN